MEKTKIKVIVADNTDATSYIDFLKLAFDVEVLKHSEMFKNKIDLVLFTGGEDVDPSFYGETKNKKTFSNLQRDEKEFDVANDLRNVPKLGICRGAQFLTVFNGGKLIQHVENHTSEHLVTIGLSTYVTTSTHHQMMYPFKLEPNLYEILGHSTYFLSDQYLNGDNENINLPDNFLEPEIVYYPLSHSLCIQGHPEHSNASDDFKVKCLQLIENYLIPHKSNQEKSKFEF